MFQPVKPRKPPKQPPGDGEKKPPKGGRAAMCLQRDIFDAVCLVFGPIGF
jgi:hypothetical protein